MSAILSPDGVYRYVLRREWDFDADDPLSCMFVMLNPSTADATQDDPTIRRCVGFAKAWGYSSLTVCNLYALRSTDPKALWKHHDPIGPDNDWHLLREAGRHELIVLAWGSHGGKQSRGSEIESRLRSGPNGLSVAHLGHTSKGEPRHPLYLPKSLYPTIFPGL